MDMSNDNVHSMSNGDFKAAVELAAEISEEEGAPVLTREQLIKLVKDNLAITLVDATAVVDSAIAAG